MCSPGEFPSKDVTHRIISCAMEVHSTLCPGLLESVYEEALEQEFVLRGYKKTNNLRVHKGEGVRFFLCIQIYKTLLF
mgnify:CR=1 FL=1